MKNRDFLQKKEEFIEQLEVGNDGTLFIREENINYSLQEILNHAFSLFYYHLLNSFGDIVDLTSEETKVRLEKAFIREAQLSFSKILLYTNNARKVLREMNLYSDDIVVENDYDVEVYRSPKDNCVVDFKKFINVLDDGENYTTTLTTDMLRNIYGVDGFFVVALEPGYAFGIEKIKLIDLERLTDREREAFYGRHAQEVLGWIPNNLTNNKKFRKIK